MSNEKPSQHINISGSRLSGPVEFGQAGRDLSQTQQTVPNSAAKNLSQKEVIALLVKIENLIKGASLPQAKREEALQYLGAAQMAAKAKKPNKQFTAMSLKQFADVLKEVNETIEVSQSIWQKVSPILKQLLPWLGVAAGFFI